MPPFCPPKPNFDVSPHNRPIEPCCRVAAARHSIGPVPPCTAQHSSPAVPRARTSGAAAWEGTNISYRTPKT